MIRSQWLVCLCALLVALSAACSDDSDGPQPDQSVHPSGDGPVEVSDAANQPWPDLPAGNDSSAWSCTPGQAGMCDDNKLFHCVDGLCAKCPPNFVDCDRIDDCECLGACDGTRCVSPGKN